MSLAKTLRGLKPIVGAGPKVLVLGSMPSPASLKKQEYYAFPQNQFWRLMAATLGEDRPETYSEKVMMLKHHKIALWDAIASCERKNALDSNIKNARPNDITGLLKKAAGIRAVFLNGRTAEAALKKYHTLSPRISVNYLPSSSPANASLSFQKKLRKWRSIKRWLS